MERLIADLQFFRRAARAFAPVQLLCLAGAALGLLDFGPAVAAAQGMLLALPVAAGADTAVVPGGRAETLAGRWLFALLCAALAAAMGLFTGVLAAGLARSAPAERVGSALSGAAAGVWVLAAVLPMSCRLSGRRGRRLILISVLLSALAAALPLSGAPLPPGRAAALYLAGLGALGLSLLAALTIRGRKNAA